MAIAEPLVGFNGTVLRPGDDGYEDARKIFNALVDKRPSVIARCTSTADVVAALNHGREEGLEISVRGGGHNVSGRAVTEGGLMIDLSPMKAVAVDAAGRTITSQPGVLWGELNEAAHSQGLATTGGVISTTGVAGLTLGGGVGWTQPKFGPAIDNLLSAEVVLATGDVVTADESSEPDLFWAIRGGGGNFGVVTSFTFRAYPLETVLGGIVAWPLDAAQDVGGLYRSLSASIDDDVMMDYALVHAPDGSGMKICAIVVCDAADDPDKAEADLRPLREFGPPAVDTVERIPYPVMNTLLDAGLPHGDLYYWKSAFFPDVPSEMIEVLVSAFGKSPSIQCGMFTELFHGAVTRVAPTATAFPHRRAGHNFIMNTQWTDPAQNEECIAWQRGLFDALRPFMSDEVYVNYLDSDDQERIRAAYGPNYERLVELKRRYDPNNLFRLNQNIVP
jgi:FAD/FMN-containing dehydrogenase